MYKKNRAFSLIEIIVVIIIVSILAGFGIANHMRSIQKARERTLVSNLISMRGGVDLYLANTGDQFIPNMADLDAINTTLGLFIKDTMGTTYQCVGNSGGITNGCIATSATGWILHFHNMGAVGTPLGGVHCSAAGPACPSCPGEGDSCG